MNVPSNTAPILAKYIRFKCFHCGKLCKAMSGLRYHIPNTHSELSNETQKALLKEAKAASERVDYAEIPEELEDVVHSNDVI
jgi:SAM-dependent MidA family methyltransferase